MYKRHYMKIIEQVIKNCLLDYISKDTNNSQYWTWWKLPGPSEYLSNGNINVMRPRAAAELLNGARGSHLIADRHTWNFVSNKNIWSIEDLKIMIDEIKSHVHVTTYLTQLKLHIQNCLPSSYRGFIEI